MATLQRIQDSPGGNNNVPQRAGLSDFWDTGINSAIGFIDKVSKLPEAISKTGENLEDAGSRLNNKMIQAGNRISQGGSKKAKGNLITGKINSIKRDIGRWLESGNNLLYAVGAVVFLIWLVRK